MANPNKVSWFTIATDDDHPMSVETLNEHTDKHAWIRHDDPRENKPHTHYVGHLPKNSRTSVAYIAKWAGVPANFVEIVRSPAGVIEYLDHSNEPDKVQYPHDKIQGNFDFDGFVASEKRKIERGHALEKILEMIDTDEVVEYNVTQKLTMTEFVRYKNEIDRAFRYKNEKGNTEDREMEVWYICGKAGSGKTTLAKFMAKQLGMDVFIASAGRNPFDDYKGQPCVILDDARPSDWKFNDFLKLTDNNTASMVGCRYYNKHFYRCQLLIVTNCEPLSQWYKGLQEYEGEALEQLTRRFSRIITIKRTDLKHGLIVARDDVDGVDLFVDCPSMLQKRSKIDLNKIGRVITQAEQTTIMDNLQPCGDTLPWDDEEA